MQSHIPVCIRLPPTNLHVSLCIQGSFIVTLKTNSDKMKKSYGNTGIKPVGVTVYTYLQIRKTLMEFIFQAWNGNSICTGDTHVHRKSHLGQVPEHIH